MADVIGRYELRGSYFLDGREGSQIGEVSHCSDNKLVGLVRDSNSSLDTKNPRFGSDKLLVGLHFPEDHAIGLLKLVPLNSLIAPVIWYATSESGEEKGLAESYDGCWQVACPSASILQIALNESMPTIEQVKTIDPDSIRRVFFNREYIETFVRRGLSMGQTGRLNFRRII